MGCSNVPTPVFIETNLGTRLAVPVSPDITTKDFKRELERMHLNCFPEYGSIRVNALMVKQKSHCYHLSESLPLKYAFLFSNVTWFLQMDVHPLNISNSVVSLKCDDTKVHNLNSTYDKRMKCKRKKVKMQRCPHLKASVLKISTVVCFLRRKRKRKNVKRKCKIGRPGQGPILRPLIDKEMLRQFATGPEVNRSKRQDTSVIAGALSDTFSEPASVSGIIKKYFSDYDEVASNSGFPFTTVWNRHKEWPNSSSECKYLNIQSDIMSPVTGHIPQVSQDVWLEKPSSEASKKKLTKPEVGKRLLLASDSLGLTPSNQQSVLSLCRYSDRKSPPYHKLSGAVRNLVFEMTDEGD